MAVWRILASVAAALAIASPGFGQTYSLAEASQAGKYFHVQINMKLNGAMQISREGQKVSIKQEATASHDFLERVLEVGSNGLPMKCAQSFKTAKATVTVANAPSDKALRAEHRLLVAQRIKDQVLTYCPAGPLTREEVELTEHFDTLSVTGLLPGKDVAVGATWKVPNAVAQALSSFEGLTAQDLECKLEQVKDNVARVTVTGKTAGIDQGALVKLVIQAQYDFDLKARRLAALEWKQKDERDQGPVSPASMDEVAVSVTRTPIEPVSELSDIALVSVPDKEPAAPLTQVSYTDKQKRFELLHAREWQRVSLTEQHLILRLMDQGDFIAQVTISPWTRVAPGKHIEPEAFKEIVAATPGWEQDQELQAGTVPAEGGRWVYRLSALGQLDGLKVMHNFYVVTSPKGEQVVLVFTMTPSQAKKIGVRDLELVGSVDFPSAAK
jgi:hypothetical protein